MVGLLFFAGITSSISLGISWMGLFQNEFQWSRSKSAWTFGAIILLMENPPLYCFFNQGVLDEYDYWSTTVCIVILAFSEEVIIRMGSRDRKRMERNHFKYRYPTPENNETSHTIRQSDLKEKITQSIDVLQRKGLEEKIFYIHLTRILLFPLFIFVCIIIRQAFKKIKE